MATRRHTLIPEGADALDILRSWDRNDPKLRAMIDTECSTAAVARQIYELRKARGLTQHQLAALVGTKQPAIARLEDADYNGHTLGMLSRIAEALGCSVSVSFVPRKLPRARTRARR